MQAKDNACGKESNKYNSTQPAPETNRAASVAARIHELEQKIKALKRTIAARQRLIDEYEKGCVTYN